MPPSAPLSMVTRMLTSQYVSEDAGGGGPAFAQANKAQSTPVIPNQVIAF